MSTELRQHRVKTFSEGSVDDLEAAVNEFFIEGGERTTEGSLIDWSYEVDGGTHNLIILYAE